jgi:hypothetical protein
MIIVCYCNNIWNHSGQKTLGLQDNYSRYRYSIVCPYSLIFPAAFEFFITLSKESSIEIEMAAIFLISTSMVWNMIFSVYESVLSIPSELLETTYAYRANPFLRLRRLCLLGIQNVYTSWPREFAWHICFFWTICTSWCGIRHVNCGYNGNRFLLLVTTGIIYYSS